MAGKNGTKKYGRQARKPTHQRYNNEDKRVKNKVRKVWKSNGAEAAREYANHNLGARSELRALEKK